MNTAVPWPQYDVAAVPAVLRKPDVLVSLPGALPRRTGNLIMVKLFGLFVLLVFLLGFLFWLWMLIDCVTKESNRGNDKLVWILVIIFTNVVGAVVYWLVRRRQRFAEFRQ